MLLYIMDERKGVPPKKRLLRYNVLISQALPNPARFTKSIFLPFDPDEVKVKQAAYYLTGSTNMLWYVKCPTLTEKPTDVLCSLVDPAICYPGITHRLGRSVNGVVQFEVYEYTNVITPKGGDLMIQLEFRKWV